MHRMVCMGVPMGHMVSLTRVVAAKTTNQFKNTRVWKAVADFFTLLQLASEQHGITTPHS